LRVNRIHLGHLPQLGSPVHGLRPSQPRLIIFLHSDWSGFPIPAAKTPDLGTLVLFRFRIYSLGAADGVAFSAGLFRLSRRSGRRWEDERENFYIVEEADFFQAPKSPTCRFFIDRADCQGPSCRVFEFASPLRRTCPTTTGFPRYLCGGRLPLGSVSL